MRGARFVILINLLLLPAIVHGQIDAVLPDSTLDEYYINYPLSSGDEYNIGDTLAAVYQNERTGWENFCIWAIRRIPFAKEKPAYVVRAVLTDTSKYSAGNKSFFKGLKLRIYSIEKYDGDSVVHINEYAKPYSECTLTVGTEKWYDIYDWVNLSGRYRILKATDNYKVGDTIYRNNYPELGLLKRKELSRRINDYSLSAIVIDIDTSDQQRLLLQFIDIEHNYHQNNFWNPSKSKMLTEYPTEVEYYYKKLSVNDLVWTKPNYWLKAGQYWQVNSGNAVPLVKGFARWGCLRTKWYDCDGNEYVIDDNN